MPLLEDAVSPKPFIPGTTGWTVEDLDDPEIEKQWFSGRYEIVEGVLTQMAAAYFSPSESLDHLMDFLRDYQKVRGQRGGFGFEVDVVVDSVRVVRADAVYLNPATKQQQRLAARAAGKPDPKRSRILVPPTVIVECLSIGHELHDRRTKRRWYAEFGVPNYWLLDVFGHTLECFVLEAGDYRLDFMGRENDLAQTSAFPGLQIPLEQVWEE